MNEQTNKYLGLSKPELKALKRANKADPAKLALIEAAIEDLKPKYGAGRLTNIEMSDLANLLKELVPTNDEQKAKIEATQAIVEKFKLQPAAAPEAPAAPTAPETPAEPSA